MEAKSEMVVVGKGGGLEWHLHYSRFPIFYMQVG